MIDSLMWRRKTKPIRRGREAVMVYIIRYILACRRSGW